MASRVSVRQAFAIGSSSYRTLLYGTALYYVPRERASDMTCPMATAKGFQELGIKALRGRGTVRQRRGESRMLCKRSSGEASEGQSQAPSKATWRLGRTRNVSPRQQKSPKSSSMFVGNRCIEQAVWMGWMGGLGWETVV